MDLFSQLDEPITLLSEGGMVNYYGTLLPHSKADNYLTYLLNDIAWKNDEVVIFGKRIVTKRKVAWYADNPVEYTYSNTTKSALPWSKELLALKALVEETTGDTFNACLLNLYQDGNEGMGWHSDAEKELKKNGAIASLSFGAERKFVLKHKKTKEKVSVVLQQASLLVMKNETQSNWAHCLPTTKKVAEPRVNLTFRTIVDN
ncbi:alpha-ketoglutarate-dependent dioxygenase AlkB [Cycloclasticus sp. 44_32_T64]|nr:alpha-ketoglutarate-dependent dioxygenase AlkB [Cycloclasticus sp. 44_32_T64]